jgi:transposase
VPASPAEQAVLARIKHARLFVFLRQQRHTLFSDAFQAELALLYRDSRRGQPPVPPAQLALATILQAYTGVSDDEAIERTTMDRRWQVVLDCLDVTIPPFSKGTLVAFRRALIAHDLDRRLIERTVEMAATSGLFGSRGLRAALDASPLWGAGRVEDTYNLIGHALHKALRVIACQQGRELAAVAREAGAEIVAGTSLKAVLDRDWDDPQARVGALTAVLAALDAVEAWLDGVPGVPLTAASMACAARVREQDVDHAAGPPALRHGVSKERLISIEDPQMRHGRKSKAHLFNGYKRHVLHDLDSGLVRAVGVTPANQPEAAVTDAVLTDLERQGAVLSEVQIDRGYLSSALVQQRPPGLAIYCKAWSVHNGGRFPKTAFVLDWERRQLHCPAGIVRELVPGGTVHFPSATCAVCALRTRCTTSAHGRSVAIHPDEQLLTELRTRQQTPAGRAKLRERIAVEHALAHIGQWQGNRARYRGERKNLFDLRRTAVVHNLHVIARTSPAERLTA